MKPGSDKTVPESKSLRVNCAVMKSSSAISWIFQFVENCWYLKGDPATGAGLSICIYLYWALKEPWTLKAAWDPKHSDLKKVDGAIITIITVTLSQQLFSWCGNWKWIELKKLGFNKGNQVFASETYLKDIFYHVQRPLYSSTLSALLQGGCDIFQHFKLVYSYERQIVLKEHCSCYGNRFSQTLQLLNSNWPKIDPWGTPLVYRKTRFCFRNMIFIKTFVISPCAKVLIHHDSFNSVS